MASIIRRVLVVDDDELARRTVCRILERAGFTSTSVGDGIQAIDALMEDEFDLVVTDLEMPGLSGIELLAHLREFSEVPVIVLTTFGTIQSCESALLGGASRFLEFQNDLSKLPYVAKELLGRRPPDRSTETPTLRQQRKKRDEDFAKLLGRLIKRTGGNVSAMAEILGRDRTTVLYHLRRLDLY